MGVECEGNMIKAGQISKGTALLIKGKPFVCIEREFVNPGKGSAFVRLKLKSPSDGQVLSETMKSQDNAEDISVEETEPRPTPEGVCITLSSTAFSPRPPGSPFPVVLR